MEIQKTGEYTARIEKEGKQYLGIDTRIKSGSYGLKKFYSEGGTEKVWIISPRGIEQWGPVLVTEHEGSVFLYGPYYETKSLASVLNNPTPDDLRYLEILNKAIQLYQEKNPEFQRIHGRGVLFLDEAETGIKDWKIMLLPEEMTSIIMDNQDTKKRMREYEAYNHPDLKGNLNLAFVFGTMSYRILTDDFPYFSDSEEDIHDRMRKMQILPPRMKKPEIRKDVSDFIYQNITTGAGKKISTLDEWRKVLREWLEGDIFEDIPEEEKKEILKRASENESKSEKNYQRRIFAQKNWRKGFVIAAAAVLILSIPISIISNALKPRATAGFSAEEVLQTFYYSMNELDHTLMEDTVVGKAGNGEVREVMNLFIMTRERYAMEGATGLADPRVWIENDRPSLPPHTNLYGVSNLEYEEIRDGDNNEETKMFRAEYLKWMPIFQSYSENVSENIPEDSTGVYERIDRLHMIKDGGDWVIDDIDRQKDELIETL